MAVFYAIVRNYCHNFHLNSMFMKTIKRFFLPLFISWSVFVPILAIMILFNSFIGIFCSITLGIVLFFTFSVWFKKRSVTQRELIIHYIILFSPIIAFSIFYLWKGPLTYYTSLNFVLAPVFGSIAGILFAYLNSLKRRIAVVGVTIIIISWIYLSGLNQWADYWNVTYYYHKYSIQTGEISEPAPAFSFTSDSIALNNTNLLGKTVIVDFWGRSCAPCLSTLPRFIELKKKYLQHKDIVFILVNISYKTETLEQAKATLKNAGFNIETYLGPEAKDAFEKLNIASYPFTWIINKEGKLIYRGKIDGVEKIIMRIK
jgi:thiol-disulfide isomerase/thioredoxin